MRTPNRRKEKLLLLMFLSLSFIVLWWELSLREEKVASKSIPDATWGRTIVTLSTTSISNQHYMPVHQESQTSNYMSAHNSLTESKSNQTNDWSIGNDTTGFRNESIPISESWADIFDGEAADISITPYRLIKMNEIEHARERMCRVMTSSCQKFQYFTKALQQGSSPPSISRLNILLADPLAWTRHHYPELSADVSMKVADRLNADRSYITYKGSDHVIVCLSQHCHQWAEEFAQMLAGDHGSRVIYIGMNVNAQQLKWPCPHRVISMDMNALRNKQFMKHILRISSLMIEKRNRWVCSDAQHPPNHFGKHNHTMEQSGIYMNEYGFLICQIPHSGNSMLMMLLRRMMHQDDWKSEEDGLPLNPQRSGVPYMNMENNDPRLKVTHIIPLMNNFMQDIYDNTSIVKAVVVQHPIPRLLSAYLDKIETEHGYSCLPGLQDYVNEHGFPSFGEFVDYLVEHYPNSYDPELDPHFRIQSSMCGLRDHKFDFVGSLSNLGQEFRELALSLDFWNPYVSSGWGADGQQSFGFSSYGRQVYDSAKKVSQYYTRDMMLKVYEYYKDDFDNFGFTLDG